MARGLILALLLGLAVESQAAPLRLTAQERAQGWRLLFDGLSITGWHTFGVSRVGANWAVEAGALVAREEGRALATDESFADFELSFQWRVEDGGRAEVYFRTSEDEDLPAHTGPIFQLAGPDVDAGGNGGLSAPSPWGGETTLSAWQRARLVVTGDHVEHWLNERLVLSYQLRSEEWRAALVGSRFANYRGYGRERDGVIAFAGRRAHFREIKLRPR